MFEELDYFYIVVSAVSDIRTLFNREDQTY